jgi:hypothetical protein
MNAFVESVLQLKPRTAAFDCDGTLWSGDAGESFFAWEVQRGFVSHTLAEQMRGRYTEYKAGKVSEDDMCGELVTMHAGMKEADLMRAAADFIEHSFPGHIFAEMRDLVQGLLTAGCDVWVVSSSNEWVIRVAMKQFGIAQDHILAAAVEIDDGVITDRLIRIPSGSGKPRALREVIGSTVDAAFGNSRWDTEMLEMARHPFAVNPNPDLLIAARTRGWTVYFPEGIRREYDCINATRLYRMSAMETSIRRPAVAGRFYPGDPQELRADIHFYLSSSDASSEPPIRAIGCIVPHAGYVYSGHVAGAVFSRIEIPELCIVLCPNHTGVGHALAIMSDGAWEIPLGKVPIDSTFAAKLKNNFDALQDDATAHRAEHATEVELPFLLVRQPKLRFVPITIGTSRFELLDRLGEVLASTIAAEKNDILIVASSDMNHYESDAITRIKDHQAIERILTLDPHGLYDIVTQQAISMCGFGPAVAMLTAARKLGARSADLVKYATSGDISGDRERVVGYAGVVIF